MWMVAVVRSFLSEAKDRFLSLLYLDGVAFAGGDTCLGYGNLGGSGFEPRPFPWFWYYPAKAQGALSRPLLLSLRVGPPLGLCFDRLQSRFA